MHVATSPSPHSLLLARWFTIAVAPPLRPVTGSTLSVHGVLGQVKVWFQNRRMKFKRQSRGHVSLDAVDASPRRSADDDDDDDDDDVECESRRRVHGPSTVTSRSASPAVDSTTADYCSLAAAERPSSGTLLQHDETPAVRGLDDDAALRRDASCLSEHDLVADQPATDDADRVCGATAQSSAVSLVETPVDVASLQTENNLARLEIMTCIAGGAGVVDAATDMTQARRAADGASSAGALTSRSSRQGRRTRSTQSRTRTAAAAAVAAAAAFSAAGGNGLVTFDTAAAMSNYRRAAVFDADSKLKNYVSDLRRDSRDFSRDLESTLAFPGGAYSDPARCVYTDLSTGDVLFPAAVGYHASAVTSAAFQQQQQMPQSFGVPTDNQFQFVVRPPCTSPASHCNVRNRGDDSFTSLPPTHSAPAASFPVCDAGWQTWRWNDCGSGGGYATTGVDYDDEYYVHVGGGERGGWRSSSWSCQRGADAAPRRCTPLAAPSCVIGDGAVPAYPCPAYDQPYHGGGGGGGSYCTSASRFYDECCYVPTSAAERQETTTTTTRRQSCKYSGGSGVDSQCRLYAPDSDIACVAPPFVNTA